MYSIYENVPAVGHINRTKPSPKINEEHQIGKKSIRSLRNTLLPCQIFTIRIQSNNCTFGKK